MPPTTRPIAHADAPIAELIDRPPRVEMLIGIPTGPMSFSADDLRQVEQAAYNDGLSDGQSRRENWAIAGFVFGVVVTLACGLFSAARVAEKPASIEDSTHFASSVNGLK